MINIEINYQTKAPQKFKALFKKVARMVFHKLKLSGDLAVSVALVNSQRIKFLNKRYRAKNTITDVLSFPQTNEKSGPSQKSFFKERTFSFVLPWFTPSPWF
jgi:ssRNA-specific RNase YbeY (16S rRNA maturation enzyme)